MQILKPAGEINGRENDSLKGTSAVYLDYKYLISKYNTDSIILFQSEINLLQTTQQLYSSLRGVKLLCSLEIQLQILLYLLQ